MTSAYHYPDDLELVTYPHPVLRKQAEPVTEFDEQLADFCKRMLVAMRDYNGVGLAAPQVGVSRQIFVSDHAGLLGDGPSQEQIWINPRMENASGSTVYEEGCLSLSPEYMPK